MTKNKEIENLIIQIKAFDNGYEVEIDRKEKRLSLIKMVKVGIHDEKWYYLSLDKYELSIRLSEERKLIELVFKLYDLALKEY